MRIGFDRGGVASTALLLALGGAAACLPERAEGAGDIARSFYQALARGDVAQARSVMAPGRRLRNLERRFGTLDSWATRATKNGIVARVEVLDETLERGVARVNVVVLFNDGTRRHDRIELLKLDGRWRIDPGSLAGARRNRSGDRALRRSAAAHSVTSECAG